MRILRPHCAVLAAMLLAAAGFAQQPRQTGPPVSKETRFQIIRLLNAEYVWVKKPIPHGDKGIVIKPDGQMVPDDAGLRQEVLNKGEVARPGQRVQITNVEFRKNKILLEINGGAVKRAKWYQRIQVSGGGGTTPVAQGPDPNAKGSFVLLEFKDHVPEMTLAGLKEILKPLFDFSVKSAAQAYTESLPENVRNAIRDHKVLVGMNKEMVTYAKGRPPQRIREKDQDNGAEYEEWIFGTPPEDVEFVRFDNDEVTRLKIMKVDGEKIVRTQREVKIEDPAAAQAAAQQQRPAALPSDTLHAPTLRRPGEPIPDDTRNIPMNPTPPPMPGPPQAPQPSDPNPGAPR